MFERLQIGLIKRGFRKYLGKDIAPLKTLAAHPGVLIPYARYTVALNKTKLVPAKLKALAQVRTAKLVACPF